MQCGLKDEPTSTQVEMTLGLYAYAPVTVLNQLGGSTLYTEVLRCRRLVVSGKDYMGV